MSSPSTRTSSPPATRVPSTAHTPLQVTRPASIHLSASRREQRPDSLMYLFSLTRLSLFSSSKEGADMVRGRGGSRPQQLTGTFEHEGLLRGARLAIHGGNRCQHQPANQFGSRGRKL